MTERWRERVRERENGSWRERRETAFVRKSRTVCDRKRDIGKGRERELE